MKRYIEISNIGSISKSAIELLGYSDKRNSKDLIGEKGTGLKFSRLQCLRKSIEMFVTTSEFINWYSKKKLDEENDQVIFRYKAKNGKAHAKPSSYTVNAGLGDWVDDWFIVREVVQNAVDETIRNKLCDNRDDAMGLVLKCVRIVNEVSFAKKGNTNVYIELTESIEKVCKNIKDYFVFEPIFSCEHGSIHAKKKEDKMRIYKQGIFVQESVMTGLYDYECSNIELSESRTLKHLGDAADEVLKIFSESPINLKREFLRYCDNNKKAFELNSAWSLTNALYNIDQWADAFYSEFGEKSVIHDNVVIPDYISEKIKMHKYNVVILQDPLFKFLKKKIKTLEELTSSYEELQYHKLEIDEHKLPTITKAIEKAKKIFKINVPVALFDPVTDLEHNTGGVFLPRRKEILINKNRCSSLEEFLPILIEELIHAETGADDGSRAFQDCAIKKISQLI
jgi:hypothetical protein